MHTEPPTPEPPGAPLSARDRLGPALLRPRQAAAYLGVSMKTLNRIPIRRVYIDNVEERLRRYRLADLDEAKERLAARALARAIKPTPRS